MRALNRLAATFPNDLVVEELDCMAACDDVPAIMVETDYYPQVSPSDLLALVQQHLEEPARASQD